MEIPYTVKSRPDTGLYNAKMGIWLFLASEVMLFGGLFSSYIFLRLKANADPQYFWPENALSVMPGFINTIVLILSSVTVLMAWASIKMRKWKQFQIYMGITLLCSLLFMCIKSYEYNGKFKHYGFLMNDGSRVEAHIHGRDTSYSHIKSITLDPKTVDLQFLSALTQSGEHKDDHASKSEHADTHGNETGGAKEKATNNAPIKFTLTTGGEAFSLNKKWLKENADLGEITIVPTTDIGIKLPTKEVKLGKKESITLQDGTSIKATRVGDFFDLAVDKIDMRTLVVRAIEDAPKGKRDEAVYQAIDNSLAAEILSHDPANVMEEYRENREKEIKVLKEKHPELDPLTQHEALRLAFMMKPEKKERGHGKKEYPHAVLSADDVKFFSNLTPKYNTYYAIYFTMTALHGLHVIGGALVLGYFLFKGKKLYDRDPEHLANRVEVGGLFWHFVDLVWIFLFPIMYLL